MRVTTNVYLRKILEKTKRGLRILKRRVRELFMHRESISTPCAHHKGRQPLIECAKRGFKIIYFPFFIIIFSNRQECCPCSYVSLGAMRKSDIRSSLIRMFMFFLKIYFNCKQRVVKALDLETKF